jgi:hypothetical protein
VCMRWYLYLVMYVSRDVFVFVFVFGNVCM